MIGQPLRTLRSTRAGLFYHDQLGASRKNDSFPAAVKVMIKTSSTEAAAGTVPPVIRPDSTGPFGARSKQLRSMFDDFESFFRALVGSQERPPGNAKVGVFTLRRLLYDCSARARGPDEPRGDPRGPGGEAQWPDGGYTAWTERATKSPAWEKG